ncbi:MAG: hypothetical protein FJ242_04070 [Nitrospira sp.]|nr:hypothetical protein [Nitrospira sp.]
MLTHLAKRCFLLIFLISAFLTFAANQVVYGHGGEEFTVSGDAWMDNYTLVITDAKDINEAYKAAEAISREGGHIGVIIPNQVMLGWVPKEKVKVLVGTNKIQSIHHKPLPGLSRKTISKILSASSANQEYSDAAENAIAFFNQVVSGEYKSNKMQVRAQMQAAGIQPQMLPDNFEAPPISYQDVMNNLLANGINEEILKEKGIYVKQNADGSISLNPGNSDYMVGKALFNAIFVESNGAADPNTYTWTAAARTEIQNEIIAGLSWWANTAFNFDTYRTPLTWVYVFRYGPLTNTSYEPITRPSSQDYLWINQIMANYGYSSGDKWARTTAFNTAMRTAYNTNWSGVSFIGYNPSPAPSTFTDGYFAYWWGTYSQLLYINNGWAVSQYDIVNAHETGHMYGAADEYAASGCNNCTTEVRNGVWNGNCANCNANSISCMMKGNSLSLCGYTPGQLGWRGVQYLGVATYRTDNGNFKNFFAPGEAIQYKAYYCLAGPRVGSNTHAVRVRFRADYIKGDLGSSTNTSDDTGWASAGTASPPTSIGLSCYVTLWNRSVPADIGHGPATLTVQIELDNLGKGAAAGYAKFYAATGADTTQPSLPLSTFEPINEGPFLEPAPLPWER